ncbi:MAG: hypothetical protein ACPGLY_06950 [Rubripirellula sp.]
MPRKFWIASIAFHGLLAVLLWFMVSRTVPRISIVLSATSAASAASSQSAALKLGQNRLTTEAPWGNDPTVGTDVEKVQIDAKLNQDLDTEILTDFNVSQFEPNSVEFFGSRAYGNQFVFVLDISYSMRARNGGRYARAAEELVRAVAQLRPDQQYCVFLFSWYTQEMFYNRRAGYTKAGGDHAQKLRTWLGQIRLDAGTDPRRALSLALQMKPDAVYLLSDGHFNQPVSPNSETGWFDADGVRSFESVLQGVEQRFDRTPIHSIAFENPFTVNTMCTIAEKTGGHFRYVQTGSLEPANLDQLSTALRQLERQFGSEPGGQAEYTARMTYARELISSGELVAAEYVLRPIPKGEKSPQGNRALLQQMTDILASELKGIRIEDFDVPGDIFNTVSDQ